LKAGIISGASFVCEGQKNVNYSIPEISNSEKDQLSHRGKALRKMAIILSQLDFA